MSLTRKGLKAMGLTEEQVDSIIDAHSETVDGLKEKLKTAEADAKKLADVSKELDEMKAKGNDGYKEKFESEHKAFEAYKKSVIEKEEKAAKESAVKKYFESKNITGKNLDLAMRATAAEIAEIVLENGEIKDTAVLDAATNEGGYLFDLIPKVETVGANIAHPPTNTAPASRTKADIMKIKDTTERQKAWGEYLKNERKL